MSEVSERSEKRSSPFREHRGYVVFDEQYTNRLGHRFFRLKTKLFPLSTWPTRWGVFFLPLKNTGLKRGVYTEHRGERNPGPGVIPLSSCAELLRTLAIIIGTRVAFRSNSTEFLLSNHFRRSASHDLFLSGDLLTSIIARRRRSRLQSFRVICLKYWGFTHLTVVTNTSRAPHYFQPPVINFFS